MSYTIVTGGAGFIGSAVVWKLNQMGIENIIIVDNLAKTEKWKNLVNLKYENYIQKNEFINLFYDKKLSPKDIDGIIHLGACSSTTETDTDYLYNNNYRYTTVLAQYATENNIRFIYASSAATYGDGALGFDDSLSSIKNLRPLNMYGYSKQIFDEFSIKHNIYDKIVGLKFFNVYGPNEYHKNDMSSVIFKAFNQINETNKLKLFKSYNPNYKDGEQLRDFVYIKDVIDVIWWFYTNKNKNGIYNLGTGKARSWVNLANATFNAMNKKTNIEFIDMPESIRDKYQYFTEAKMAKLKKAGYTEDFYTLEDGAKDYIQNYLMKKNPYLGN